MIIQTNRNIEKIEKQGKPLVLGIKSCKTYRKALQTLIGQQARKGNTELEFYTRGLLELYNKFHPEKVSEVEVKRWKGKSSIEIIKELDKLIIIKYQKPSQDEEPIEVRTEVSHNELVHLIDAIKTLWKGEPIKTKDLAEAYSYMELIGEVFYNDGQNFSWKLFFSNRALHNKFCLMLSALREEGLIEYKHGETKLLNKDISIQMIL